MPQPIRGGTGPHYYQEIFADPNVFDRVYRMDPEQMVTDDEGKTRRRVGERNKHVDNHALAFLPGDPDYLLSGCDGGLYESADRGRTRANIGAGLPDRTIVWSVAQDNMKKALLVTPGADPELGEKIDALGKRLRAAMRTLSGDRALRRRSEPIEPSLMNRVGAQLSTTCPITATAKRGYEIAAESYGKLQEDLRNMIELDLRKLGDALEAAGAPWTPGRGVPVCKR